MTKIRTIQILRGTTVQNDAYTGSAGELTMDTTTNELRLHDGSTQGGKVIGGGSSGSGLNIGDIFYTMRTDNELNGAVECDGATYNTTDFTGAQSIGTLLEAGKVPYVSLTQYATLLSTNGSVGVFGWDGVGNTAFRVPSLNDIFIESGTAAQIGDYVAAGLPNITGTFRNSAFSGASGQALQTDGTFYATDAGNSVYSGAGGGSANSLSTIHIDASRSSSIYGNSNTVQPNTVRYRAMVQLAVSATDQALETCTGVLADVAGLKDLSNITSAGKEVCANLAMPSNSYINLTLGASGAKYTAPADGYITVSKQAGASGQELELKNETTTLSIKMASYGTSSPSLIMLVSKNDEFSVKYNTSGTTWYFRFVYANGAV